MNSAEIEKEPAVAAELAGEHIHTLRKFTQDLATRGEELGLIGPSEAARIWTRHVLNCALVAPLLKKGSLADIGSGAGLPGLVIAILRPDIHCTLIEPMDRRVQWLNEQVDRLGLENVSVRRARAEDIQGHETFDTVTARAVSALKKLIPMSVPLVNPNGQLVFMKGERVAEEMQNAEKIITKLRLSQPEVLVLGESGLVEQTRVFRATVGKA